MARSASGRPFTRREVLAMLAAGSGPSATSPNDRLLVIVEMPGGNDGISMAVPYGLGAYYDLRDTTAIAPGEVLHLDDEIGLHPDLTNLHRRGVTLVEGVGSFHPNGSHFEMMSQWWAGNSDGLNSDTGWVGRLSDILGGSSEDVRALAIGYGNHPIAKSRNGSALALSGAESLQAIAGASQDNAEAYAFQQAIRTMAGSGESAGIEGRLRSTLGSALTFADRLSESYSLDEESFAAQRDQFGYSESWLSTSLMFASGVLASDVGIRVVYVAMDSEFDTHIDHNTGHYASMANLDTSLNAFHDDINAKGLSDRVRIMTTSEFGRTPSENGSGGLDHGAASTLMLSGPGTGGRVGEPSSLTDFDDDGDFKANVAFESYLSGVVQDWLGVPSSEVFGDAEPLSVL